MTPSKDKIWAPIPYSLSVSELGFSLLLSPEFSSTNIPFSFPIPEKKVALLTKIEGLKTDPVIINELKIVARKLVKKIVSFFKNYKL